MSKVGLAWLMTLSVGLCSLSARANDYKEAMKLFRLGEVHAGYHLLQKAAYEDGNVEAQAELMKLQEKNPLSALNFSEDHIRDLLEVCFGQYHDCRLLTRENMGKIEVILLIGERHSQPKAAFDLGAKLLQHFPTVGLEGIIYRLPETLYNTIIENHVFGRTLYHKEYELRTGNNRVLQKDRGEYRYSLLNYEKTLDPRDSQKVFNLEWKKVDPNQDPEEREEVKLRNSKEKCMFAFTTLVGHAIGLQLSGKNMTSGDGILLCIPGTLFTGAAIDWISYRRACIDPDKSMMRKRDQAMGAALEALYSLEVSSEEAQFMKSSKVAGVMGLAHLYGVSRFLESRGFENRALNLMSQWLDSTKTSLQTLSATGLTHLSLGRAGHAFIERIYPEDFAPTNSQKEVAISVRRDDDDDKKNPSCFTRVRARLKHSMSHCAIQ